MRRSFVFGIIISMSVLPQSQRVLFFEAIAVIVGTIVGAGLFAIPYAVAQVGFGIGIAYLLGMGLIVLALHVLLGEIVARTKTSLQLSGLAGRYLGTTGKALMGAAVFLGGYGALLAYLIGTGEALTAIFGGERVAWSMAFFAIGAFFLYRGLKTVKVIELFMTSAIFLLVITLVIWAAPDITVAHLAAPVDWRYIFLPYGVLLFAYYGVSALPVAEAVLRGDARLFRRAVIIASTIPVVLYTLFAAVTVGVTGDATTPIATVGLGEALGPLVGVVSNLFAFFAMATSFLAIGTALRETYECDFRWNPRLGWAATVAVPLALFAFGVRDFIQVVGVTGTLAGSIEAILIVLIYWKVQREADYGPRRFHVRYAPLASAVLLAVFGLAAAYSLWEFFV